MANQTITQLPDAGPITGTELVPIVQNGGTYKTTTAAISASPSQPYQYLTIVQTPQLPNSRFLSTGTGVGLVDGGAQSFYRITLNGVAGTLESMGNGFGVKVGGTMTPRSIAVSGAGLSITNGDGQSGNPTVSLDGTVGSLASNGGTGFLALPGNGSVSGRTLTGTANQIGITNPNGIAGNPTFSIADNAVLPGTGGAVMPNGTTAERPGLPAAGLIRYNTTTGRLEGYTTSWQTFGSGDGTVTSVSGTANEITVTNGTTTPVVGLASNPVIPGTAGVKVPSGVTSERPGSPTNGFFRYNSQIGLFEGYANGAWDQFTTGGSGVTSVGLALPSDFTVTNSPVTSAGTLTGAWASQAANRVLASPNGSSGTPTFRALANNDLPNSGVTANTYGSSTQVPVVTVNSKGVITGVTLSTIVGTLNYQGTWNASTNTPTLTSSVGVAGYYYVVDVAGTTNLNGITDWQVGDWVIFNGTIWQKVDQTNTVSSVNGQTGAVSLTYSDVGAPSTSGVNATGTWGIDISGKAANITGGAAGDLVVQTATGVTNFIPAGLTSAPSNGKILIGNGTGFTVANLTAGTNVTITNTAGGITISSAGASVDDVIALAIALG
jgi:hypothetical protein